jgi:hypothetical protein
VAETILMERHFWPSKPKDKSVVNGRHDARHVHDPAKGGRFVVVRAADEMEVSEHETMDAASDAAADCCGKASYPEKRWWSLASQPVAPKK